MKIVSLCKHDWSGYTGYKITCEDSVILAGISETPLCTAETAAYMEMYKDNVLIESGSVDGKNIVEIVIKLGEPPLFIPDKHIHSFCVRLDTEETIVLMLCSDPYGVYREYKTILEIK